MNASPERSQQEKETFGAYVEITGPVFYSRSLSDKSKLLYGLLCAMTQAPRYYAYARNRTMTRFLDCSERTLQRCLAELEACGEIRIEGDRGGKTLRKIFVSRLQPFYPDKNDGGNINTQSKNKTTGKARAAASKEELLEWLDAWVAKLDIGADESVKLCRDLHSMVDNRAAKGKPYMTIEAVSRMTNRLLAYTAGMDFPVARMRYIIGESIEHNWEKLYPIKDDMMDDFYAFLRSEYGIEQKPGVSEDYF